MLERMTRLSIERPKVIIGVMVLLTVLFGAQFPKIAIDTDPENMLEPDQAERIFYNQVKKSFGIHDLIVVGIVDEKGIFRPDSLQRVARATAEILKIKGVIIEDVVSLTTTDNVKSSAGVLDIHPVMTTIPQTVETIDQLQREIANNPFLDEKIASDDGTALALYVPIQEKKISYRVAGEIEQILQQELLPGQSYHFAGLPVAEDTFGHEMFVQMVVVAPLAFMTILLLVYLLFRQRAFLLPVGMDAMFAVVWTMGLLISTGNTVHIMSSMIPVFLMPIAILDDIHILSEFFDRYRTGGDKRQVIMEAMQPLYRPMLFTSLTTAVGFASLALADIPPVRVFGLFMAFGIMGAWLLSITMVPALLSLMSNEKLEKARQQTTGDRSPILERLLHPVKQLSFLRARTVLIVVLLAFGAGASGLTHLQVNDNPVRWFKPDHPMRVADNTLNRLFGGTYMAYLVVQGEKPEAIKNPQVVSYLDRVQSHLESDPLIGKTSSVADIVKRINLVLHDNDRAYDRVPDTPEAVGQFLFLFQSSGDPDDLDNFVDLEAQQANIWVQMKGGDNQQMQQVVDRLSAFLAANPPPQGISFTWSGLTYINKVWQDLMVIGMLKAILGSFAVVFILMSFEFRSVMLGLLAMAPLSMAILLTYGLAGWIGKDYDMPIAVCSSLTLGLGIDFAIHYMQRFRTHYARSGNLEQSHNHMFGGPGLAIARNAIVISVGFLPLVLATLTTYVTVGVFFALLMVFTTLATLFFLPSIFRLAGERILNGGSA